MAANKGNVKKATILHTSGYGFGLILAQAWLCQGRTSARGMQRRDKYLEQRSTYCLLATVTIT